MRTALSLGKRPGNSSAGRAQAVHAAVAEARPGSPCHWALDILLRGCVQRLVFASNGDRSSLGAGATRPTVRGVGFLLVCQHQWKSPQKLKKKKNDVLGERGTQHRAVLPHDCPGAGLAQEEPRGSPPSRGTQGPRQATVPRHRAGCFTLTGTESQGREGPPRHLRWAAWSQVHTLPSQPPPPAEPAVAPPAPSQRRDRPSKTSGDASS